MKIQNITPVSMKSTKWATKLQQKKQILLGAVDNVASSIRAKAYKFKTQNQPIVKVIANEHYTERQKYVTPYYLESLAKGSTQKEAQNALYAMIGTTNGFAYKNAQESAKVFEQAETIKKINESMSKLS